MESGRIVVLNGPSSSGKSTTATHFQASMPGPWWHTGMDALSAMLPSEESKRAQCGIERFVSALHRFVADLARHGHDVIYETGFLEQAWIDDFRSATEGLAVFHVEFVIPLESVREWERGRADRPNGYSESSYSHMLRVPSALFLEAASLEPEARAENIRTFVLG